MRQCQPERSAWHHRALSTAAARAASADADHGHTRCWAPSRARPTAAARRSSPHGERHAWTRVDRPSRVG